MLIGGLAGVADKSLYMFRVNVSELSMSPLSVSNILNNGTNLNLPDLDNLNLDNLNIPNHHQQRQAQTENITADDLGLFEVYDVNIWNYCYIDEDDKRHCAKSAFNWAAKELNMTTDGWNSMLTSTGLNVSLPEEITDAINAFGTVSKWTQIVFCIAYVALAVELLVGLFAGFSRAISCITWLVALVATVATGAAAALATATAVIVVGALEATDEMYGVDAEVNTRFLATVWLGVAFALGAGLFWMFSICCCKPDHSSSKRSIRSRDEHEKFIPSGPGYQRISDPHGPTAYQGGGGYAQPYPAPSYGAPKNERTGAYEPFSHARV
jgi:hypothetical protein